MPLLSDDELDEGYGPSWTVPAKTTMGVPDGDDVARISTGGLRQDRTTGVIEVDFGAETLRLVAFEFYGGDTITERALDAAFLASARLVPWPLVRRRG